MNLNWIKFQSMLLLTNMAILKLFCRQSMLCMAECNFICVRTTGKNYHLDRHSLKTVIQFTWTLIYEATVVLILFTQAGDRESLHAFNKYSSCSSGLTLYGKGKKRIVFFLKTTTSIISALQSNTRLS